MQMLCCAGYRVQGSFIEFNLLHACHSLEVQSCACQGSACSWHPREYVAGESGGLW